MEGRKIIDNDFVYTKVAESLRKQRLVFFIGSGLSVEAPASLPAGILLRNKMIELVKRNIDLANICTRRQLDELKKLEQEVPFEVVWEKYINILGEKCLDALQILNGGLPNVNHKIIISLAQEGFINCVITLNFDLMFENAATDMGLDFRQIYTNEGFAGFESKKTDKRFTISKLHGSFGIDGSTNNSIVATVRTIRAIPPKAKLKFLELIVNKNDIFCCGYGDKDIDTFPIIRNTKNNVFWLCYEPNGIAVIKELNSWYKSDQRNLLVMKHENCVLRYSEALYQIASKLNAQNIMKIIDDFSKKDHINNTDKLMKNVEDFCNRIAKYFSSGVYERNIEKALIYSTLISDYGFEDISAKIAELYFGRQSEIRRYPRLLCKAMLLIGNIDHSCAEFSNATKSYRTGSHIKLADPIDKFRCRIELASAYFTEYKHKPYKIWLFFMYLSTIRCRWMHSQTFYGRFLWERGDMWQYFAEYFTEFLKPVIAFLMKLKNRSIARRILNHGLSLNRLYGYVMCPVRRCFCNKSFQYYNKLTTLYNKTSNIDIDPGFTILTRLRRSEVLAMLDYIEMASDNHEDMLRFSEWIHKGGHGYANALCTQGIILYYGGEYIQSANYLSKALENYKLHKAGIIKAKTYLALIKVEKGNIIEAIDTIV